MFQAREHWLEETYFRKRDQELIERLHERRARETERQHMAEVTGITDRQMLQDLQADGYTETTVALLPLIPLVEVAWAEGGVADRERRMIFDLARERGVEPGSLANEQLTAWLDKRPPERFFEDTLHALGLMLESMPPADREASREDLLAYCNRIAELVAGGILGRGQIGDQERALIAHIAEEIGA
jgi:hypothetical protein